jgi:hypothetical protein
MLQSLRLLYFSRETRTPTLFCYVFAIPNVGCFREWLRWFTMSSMSTRAEDPLVAEIRHALMPGRFVKWDAVSGLVDNLDQVNEKVEALVKAGETERAVRLYEVFLAGVYAKIEEADDECDLANLFHRLICGWIQARQAAGQPAE